MNYQSQECSIPIVLRGSWFSWESGENTLTELNAVSMTRRGRCVAMKDDYHVNYTFVFQSDHCYYCVQIFVRTVNVLEKIESKQISDFCYCNLSFKEK